MHARDEELIANYLNGDEQSFKTLVDRYTPILYNFIVRFVGENTAPDILQEVFFKVWKNLSKFDVTRAQFKTWVFTIARNTTTDYLRKKKALTFSTLDGPDGESFADDIQSGDMPLDESFARIEDAKVLNDMLAKLSPDYQRVLMMYYQEDMTFSQIGEVLGKPLNTVKSHHRRALEQLRKMIV